MCNPQLEGLKKKTKPLSRVSRCPARDQNREFSEFKSQVLLPEPTCPVRVLLEALKVAHLVKKFSVHLEIRSFIVIFVKKPPLLSTLSPMNAAHTSPLPLLKKHGCYIETFTCILRFWSVMCTTSLHLSSAMCIACAVANCSRGWTSLRYNCRSSFMHWTRPLVSMNTCNTKQQTHVATKMKIRQTVSRGVIVWSLYSKSPASNLGQGTVYSNIFILNLLFYIGKRG